MLPFYIKTSSILFITFSLYLANLPVLLSNPDSNFRVLADAKGCWLNSYGRGVGKPITVCPDGLEESSFICYPPCTKGDTGVGPVCWENCPDGFKDTGADCLKPASYGRGTGWASWHYNQCVDANPQGCEGYWGYYYPKCAKNFHAAGCCVCSPDCPSDMADVGISCQKNHYGRGAGEPLVCTKEQEESAGLCYTPCRSGFKGVGPVCWGSCPSNLPYQCGALCVENSGECANDVFKITEAVFKFIITLAESGETGDFVDAIKDGLNLSSQFTQYGICNK